MRYTVSDCLILYANEEDREAIRGMLVTDVENYTTDMEYEALEHLMSNSSLSWIRPEEIDALTSAPILGFRDENENVVRVWGFMDYAVRSFLQDLVETGKAVFTS